MMVNKVDDMLAADKDPRIDSVLSERYKIVEKIGAGGMGVVYRAERLELDKPVAIKFLQEFFVSNETLVARFKREARAMSKLTHPYCVSVIDYGIAGAPYIVMDYVEGKTLKEVMEEVRFGKCRAVRIASQILAGMAHAHGHGIIHRDIKPANVMLCDAEGLGEHARIFDFGLAKLLDTSVDAAVTATAGLLGTPDYMSPEQSRGGKDVDARTDLYAAGVVLFELITGTRPFVNEHAFEVMKQHRETLAPTLKDVDPGGSCSPELEEVVAKSLEKIPDERYQSAAQFLEALQATPEGVDSMCDAPSEACRALNTVGPAVESTVLLEEAKPEMRPTASSIQPELYQSKPRARKFAMVAVVGIVLVAIAIFGVMQNKKEPVADTPPAKAEVSDPGEPKEEAKDTSLETQVSSIDDVNKLVDKGELEAAIEGVLKLRREKPDDPDIALLLGNLYFQKKWFSDALERYKLAIVLDKSYRGNRELNLNVIAMMGGEKQSKKARAFVLDIVGKPAIPFLEQASKENENPRIRRRALSLAKEIKTK